MAQNASERPVSDGADEQPVVTEAAPPRGRIAKLSPSERKRIASLGAAARWGKKRARVTKRSNYADIEPDRAVLLAATRVFAARGYDKPTLRELAEVAGVGLQTIYRYYPTKRDLYLKCCEHLLDRYMQHFDQLVTTHKRPEIKLYALALGLAETHFSPDLIRLIHRELLEPNSDVVNEAYGAQLRPHFELYFETARAFAGADAAERVVALISLIMGAVQFQPVSDLLRSVTAIPKDIEEIALLGLRIAFPDIAWKSMRPDVQFVPFRF